MEMAEVDDQIGAVQVQYASLSVLPIFSSQDLPRTFPGHRWVESEEGQESLRRVLLALSIHCPDVGYCQGLNFVAAILLLCVEQVWTLATSMQHACNIHATSVFVLIL